MRSIADQLKEYEMHLRIYEAASPREAAIALSRARRHYGDQQGRLHFGYAGIHGLEKIQGLLLGANNEEYLLPEQLLAGADSPNVYSLPRSNHKGLGSLFVPGAPFTANNCYGAREKDMPSMAHIWAVATGTTVHACEYSCRLPTVTISADAEKGGLTVETGYTSKGVPVSSTVFDGRELRANPHQHPKYKFGLPTYPSKDKLTETLRRITRTMKSQ